VPLNTDLSGSRNAISNAEINPAVDLPWLAAFPETAPGLVSFRVITNPLTEADYSRSVGMATGIA